MANPHNKRLDLQGLRGWAVSAVVLFHFFPDLLRYGYLGVDVFFVLSGFLIALVLDKPSFLSLSTYRDFYFKRFRRIFPLLLLISLICIIYLQLTQSGHMLRFNLQSAWSAVLFTTNLRSQSNGEAYFRALQSASDLFTHSWSLAVEIQFYSFIPMIFLHVKYIAGPRGPMTILFFSTLSSISLIYFIELNKANEAFGSTIARLWQFLCGVIAFQWSTRTTPAKVSILNIEKDDEEEEERQVVDEVMCKAIAIFLMLIPLPLLYMYNTNDLLRRVVVTALTGVIIHLRLDTPLLDHSIIVYIGDVSYALYLIHWPVVCAIKDFGLVSVPERVIVMFMCVVVSIMVHEMYEKWYLQLTATRTIILTSILYIFCFSSLVLQLPESQPAILRTVDKRLLYFRDNDTAPVMNFKEEFKRNLSIEEIKSINDLYERNWIPNLDLDSATREGWQDEKAPFGHSIMPNGTGSLRFLIIGNSYALNHARLIFKHFKHHFSTLQLYTLPNCAPIITTTIVRSCWNAHEKFVNVVKDIRPDILIVQQLWTEIDPMIDFDIPSITQDTLYKELIRDLEDYSTFTKKIFILGALPRPFVVHEALEKRLEDNLVIDGYMMEATRNNGEAMIKRVDEAAKHCSNCVVYNIWKHLLNKDGKISFYHPHTRLQYFEDTDHITPYGLRLIESTYEKLSKNFVQLINSTYPYNIIE